MKYTLLDLVQTVLSSMDSDEVNSITDTVEAQQVATVIKTVYFDIVTRANLPEHYTITSLLGSGTASKPTLMTLPDSIAEIYWVKYNIIADGETDPNFQPIEFVELPTFIDRMDALKLSDDNVASFTHSLDGNNIDFLYQNDKAPEIYTSLNDNTLLFDSYDSVVDTTLQGSKTKAYARKNIPFTMSNTFVPDLDDQQTALLLNESKALAWAELKQTSHAKAEMNAHRGWNRLQSTKFRTETTDFFDRLPNYGRK